MVLLPSQQYRLLKPRDGRAHPGVVRGGVPLEDLFLVLAEDLAGRGYDLATQTLFPIQVAQRSQDAVDFPPGEPRICRQAKLSLHIVRRIEQHATRHLSVAAGAAGLLYVVLQRSRDVGVDHQPHVRLVDAHAEGIGSRDHAQFAADETLLHVLLGLRRQPGVEVIRRDLLVLQELRHLFGLLSRRTIDNGTAGRIRRQAIH